MKKILIKALSFVLCSILLVGAVYTVPTIAASNGTATLTPVKMTYVHSHSTISGSNRGIFRALWNNYCAAYAITLESDTAFDISAYNTSFSGRGSTAYLSSYENAGNLDFAHVYGTEASATHDALAATLRENIYINGMSLGDAMESNTDFNYTSLLVGITGNKITIMIPVGLYNATEDRTNANRNFNNATHGFYVGDYNYDNIPLAKDFTISTGEGLVIGGVAVKPINYQFTATNESTSKTGTFTELIVDKRAVLSPVKMTYAHSHSTISGSNKGVFRALWNNYCAVYAITLESDTAFDVSAYDTSFSGRGGTAYLSSYENVGGLDFAHVYGTEASATHDALATMLRDNIYINGTSLGDAMESNTDFNYTSLLVGITGNKITIMIPVGLYNATEDRTNANRNFNNATHGFYVGDYNYDNIPLAKDFTISTGEGLVIGDVAVKPMCYRFTATNESIAKTGAFNEIKIDVMGASVKTDNSPDIRFEINADFDTYATYGIEEVGVIMIPTAFVTNGDNVVGLDAKYYKDMKPAIKKLSATDVAGTTQIFAVLKNSSAKDIRIRTDISARAYIKFNDGTIVYSQNYDSRIDILKGTSSRSCIDVVRAIVSKNNITGVDTILAKADKEWTIDEYNTVISTINQQLYGS